MFTLDKWAKNEHAFKDTIGFVYEMLNTKNYNHTIVSFDVNSFYTNIPLSETIALILRLDFDNNASVFNRCRRNLL